MQMCTSHWEMLKKAIDDRGLSHLIAPDGETVIEMLKDELDKKETTPTNFDPLMSAHNMILNNAFDIVGPQMLFENFVEPCPLCFLNSQRNEDGSCKCGQDDCKAKAPGSVENFDTWIDRAADGAKRYVETEMSAP